MTRFYKLSGSGNDFLALAEPAQTPGPETIRAWCRRGVSLGGDGLFLLRRAEDGATMEYFNADGHGRSLPERHPLRRPARLPSRLGPRAGPPAHGRRRGLRPAGRRIARGGGAPGA